MEVLNDVRGIARQGEYPITPWGYQLFVDKAMCICSVQQDSLGILGQLGIKLLNVQLGIELLNSSSEWMV